MDEDKGQLDDQPPAHPPPKPPSSDVRLLSFQPLAASAEVDTTFASADLPPTGFVRKLSTPHEQQSSWRRNPVKRGRKKTLDQSISHKIKLEAEAEATAVAAVAAGGSSSAVDNPKTFKSAVGRHSLVIKRTPGATATSPSILADKEKPILAASSASPASKKKPPKDKHRRSKSEIKLPSKKASETLIYLADP